MKKTLGATLLSALLLTGCQGQQEKTTDELCRFFNEFSLEDPHQVVGELGRKIDDANPKLAEPYERLARYVDGPEASYQQAAGDFSDACYASGWYNG